MVTVVSAHDKVKGLEQFLRLVVQLNIRRRPRVLGLGGLDVDRASLALAQLGRLHLHLQHGRPVYPLEPRVCLDLVDTAPVIQQIAHR